MELGLRLSVELRMANNLDYWRASRWRKAFYCARGWKVDCVFGIGSDAFWKWREN